MALDKSLSAGSTPMLILNLIEHEDMYGYQMIETLRRRSNDVFYLKAGTLYPLLHDLEMQGLIASYESVAESGRVRKYYALTHAGHDSLAKRKAEWSAFSGAVEQVLAGGVSLAAV